MLINSTLASGASPQQQMTIRRGTDWERRALRIQATTQAESRTFQELAKKLGERQASLAVLGKKTQAGISHENMKAN